MKLTWHQIGSWASANKSDIAKFVGSLVVLCFSRWGRKALPAMSTLVPLWVVLLVLSVLALVFYLQRLIKGKWICKGIPAEELDPPAYMYPPGLWECDGSFYSLHGVRWPLFVHSERRSEDIGGPRCPECNNALREDHHTRAGVR